MLCATPPPGMPGQTREAGDIGVHDRGAGVVIT